MSRRAPFGAPDWVAAAAVGLVVLGLFGFPPLMGQPAAGMFADFGGELPALTELVVTVWFAPTLGAAVLALAVIAMAAPAPAGVRRAVLIAAAGIGLLSCGLCVWGVYAPIYEVAGAIQETSW